MTLASDWSRKQQTRLAAKMHQVVSRHQDQIPYDPVNGRYQKDHSDEISNWTNGFWGGILWQLYQWQDDPLYLHEARHLEQKQDAIFLNNAGFDHDSGFKWLPTAVVDQLVTGWPAVQNRGLLAATNLAGRFNYHGRFIRAWNDRPDGIDTRGWVIIDSMMNLPLLYWASAQTDDPRFKQIAMQHAETVRTNFIRDNGSVEHIVEFDPVSGDKVTTHGGQGMFNGSAWTRGQGWGIYGFTLSYQATGESSFLAAAEQIAAYFIDHIPENGHIPADFAQPATVAYEDDSAAAVAACGLLTLATCVPEDIAQRYQSVALRLLKVLADEDANWDPDIDPLLMKGTGSYADPIHNYPMLYADFYYLLAIAKLNGNAIPIW